jgi:hypothetical protein
VLANLVKVVFLIVTCTQVSQKHHCATPSLRTSLLHLSISFETIGQPPPTAAQNNMRKTIKEIDSITPLNIPVPPMLAKAFGYKGEARYVSFQWTPYGDEADYADGRLSGTGN